MRARSNALVKALIYCAKQRNDANSGHIQAQGVVMGIVNTMGHDLLFTKLIRGKQNRMSGSNELKKKAPHSGAFKIIYIVALKVFEVHVDNLFLNDHLVVFYTSHSSQTNNVLTGR